MALFYRYGAQSLDNFKSNSIEIRGENIVGEEMPSLIFGISPTFNLLNDRSYLAMQSSRDQATHGNFPSSIYVMKPDSSKPYHQRRPCLKSPTSKPLSDSFRVEKTNVPLNPITHSKHVTFADSKGFELTRIKYLYEAPNEPPRSFTEGESFYEALKNLRLTSCDEKTHSLKPQMKPQTRFHLTFPQPFADFQDFRQRLEDGGVVLENCSIESSGVLSGSIKVKNFAFNKEVIVRITCDQWKTFVDRLCSFDPNSSRCDPSHDTFIFNINDLARSLPTNCTSAHFCIKYTCAGHEYWDSNKGANYTINVSQSPLDQRLNMSSDRLKSEYKGLRKTPLTYTELPTPQQSGWSNLDVEVPFY